MAIIVERTLHETGLDLTTVDFCTRGQRLYSHPIQMNPQKTLGWLLGCLCIQDTLLPTGSTSKHDLCCSGWICRTTLSSLILKKIQRCLLSLQNHTWAHCTACCKSPKYHWANTGMTPLPTSPDPVPAWAVLTFPWAGAWPAAPQRFLLQIFHSNAPPRRLAQSLSHCPHPFCFWKMTLTQTGWVEFGFSCSSLNSQTSAGLKKAFYNTSLYLWWCYFLHFF